MEKKKSSPLLWLLLIPGQIIAGFLFVRLGTLIDLGIFSGSEGQGHGVPIFSVIFLLVAIVATLAVFILSLILTVRGFRRGRK